MDERERNGDWLDVIEADVLRQALLSELEHEPAWLAWRNLCAVLAGAAPVSEPAPTPPPATPPLAPAVAVDAPMSATQRARSVAERLPTLAPSYATVRIGRDRTPHGSAPLNGRPAPSSTAGREPIIAAAAPHDEAPLPETPHSEPTHSELSLDEAHVVIHRRAQAEMQSAPAARQQPAAVEPDNTMPAAPIPAAVPAVIDDIAPDVIEPEHVAHEDDTHEDTTEVVIRRRATTSPAAPDRSQPEPETTAHSHPQPAPAMSPAEEASVTIVSRRTSGAANELSASAAPDTVSMRGTSHRPTPAFVLSPDPRRRLLTLARRFRFDRRRP